MKTFRFYGLLLGLLMVCLFGFTACDNDDEEEVEENGFFQTGSDDAGSSSAPTTVFTYTVTTDQLTADQLLFYDYNVSVTMADGTVSNYNITEPQSVIVESPKQDIVINIVGTPKENIANLIDPTATYTFSESSAINVVKESVTKSAATQTRGTGITKTGEYFLLNIDYYAYNITYVSDSTGYQATTNNNTNTVTQIPPKAVDLGLSVKWASIDVEEDVENMYNNFYAWGETKWRATFSWNEYLLCIGNGYHNFTKYCTSSSYGTVDNKTSLEASDDVASVKLGGNWRMPTKEEAQELIDECTWVWANDGVSDGYMVTGPNGNSIFLRAGGYHNENSKPLYGNPLNWNKYGYFWLRDLNISEPLYAYYLTFKAEDVSTVHIESNGQRRFGLHVRGVLPY